jgi:hypothetical protein
LPNITIDEKEYDTESMSEEALGQLQSLQFVDNEIVRLQVKVAAMQTARNAYAAALRSILENREKADDDGATISIPDDLNLD